MNKINSWDDIEDNVLFKMENGDKEIKVTDKDGKGFVSLDKATTPASTLQYDFMIPTIAFRLLQLMCGNDWKDITLIARKEK